MRHQKDRIGSVWFLRVVAVWLYMLYAGALMVRVLTLHVFIYLFIAAWAAIGSTGFTGIGGFMFACTKALG